MGEVAAALRNLDAGTDWGDYMSENDELRGFLSQALDATNGLTKPGGEEANELVEQIVPALSVKSVLAPKLSLADFQNAVPLIRDLAVVSTLTEDTGQLEVCVR